MTPVSATCSRRSQASPFPIQIWEFDAGRLRDVTQLFPGQVALDAKQLWGAYLEHRRKDDVRGVLAAWQADQYLLGRDDAGWRELERALKRGDLQGPNGSWPTGGATSSAPRVPRQDGLRLARTASHASSPAATTSGMKRATSGAVAVPGSSPSHSQPAAWSGPVSVTPTA